MHAHTSKDINRVRPIRAFLLLSGGLAFAPLASAAEDGEWHVTASTYGWFADTTSRVDTPFGAARTELSASDAVDSLEGALMGSIAASKGKWSVVGDLFYLDLSLKNDTPYGRLFSGVTTRTRLVSLATFGLYSFYQGERLALDAGLGARLVSSDLDVTFEGVSRRDREFSVSDTWVDPLVAVRASVEMSERWRMVLWLDGGGFEIGDASKRTWQVASTLTYALNDKWSLSGGYRQIYLDRETDGGPYDLRLSGPLAGLSYRF